ncbi:putative non-specific serine/threonine protein kinase [Helianthus annuus]|nr:putative non-specific serine/threonine protein kinase [Helianthus annuus]
MVIVLRIWAFLLFSLQTQVAVISQSLACNSNDIRGLTGFMKGLESPVDGWWPANSSSSYYCCNWVGITCNSSSGRIVKLELPNKKLHGVFSHSVAYLDQLTTLNLSYNSLLGPLPNSLFHLTHLEALDLSGNKFNSDLPVSLNLPALQVFNISDNNFTGFLPFDLCVNSSRIRVLNFASNYFTGIIPPQVGNCTFLEHLSVASNSISGIIPDFLLRLPRLQELALENNEFTTISGIGDSFSQLVHWDISSNRLSGNIPDIFHSFPKLSYFSAHSNNLSGMIPQSLSNSRTISSLNLGHNSLDGSVDINCSTMINLTSLDLGTNNFSGTIPANLASCPKLKALNLARNKLMTGQIPESFKNFESLSYLSLSNCSFNNLSSSLRILQHCPNLTLLVLTMNFYTEALPADDDLQFKALKALVIGNCKLKGSIPSWLNGLTELQMLDLSFNQLTGMIPAYLGDFKSLFYLNLAYNSLSGEIPKSILRLESMISRDISSEEPPLDFPLLKPKSLQYKQITRFPTLLDVSGNLLTGPIWPEFGNLQKLQVLDLKYNRLSGTIPSSLSGMRSIETLYLSYNNLTGTIPPSLAKLNFLSKFSVAYNNLKGVIPTGGQFSTFSNSSFEGNPGLCGEFFVKCPKDQESSKVPEFEDENDDDDDDILRFLVLTGFGSGFLVTVISLLVVPRIR